MRCIAGLLTPVAGEVRLDGRPLRAGAPRGAVGYIPEDRATDGLALELPVWLNAVAKRTAKWAAGGASTAAAWPAHRAVLDRLGVVPARRRYGPALSGGNQQRLVIGRELDGAPPIVVASEPTRGLDPASTLDVIEALRGHGRRGAAVLVVSSELDELLLVAQRIVVLLAVDSCSTSPGPTPTAFDRRPSHGGA